MNSFLLACRIINVITMYHFILGKKKSLKKMHWNRTASTGFCSVDCTTNTASKEHPPLKRDAQISLKAINHSRNILKRHYSPLSTKICGISHIFWSEFRNVPWWMRSKFKRKRITCVYHQLISFNWRKSTTGCCVWNPVLQCSHNCTAQMESFNRHVHLTKVPRWNELPLIFWPM